MRSLSLQRMNAGFARAYGSMPAYLAAGKIRPKVAPT
jgi:hypothetical protein